VTRSTRTKLAVALAVVAAVVVAASVLTSRRLLSYCCAHEWRRYRQPNGAHQIVVYRIPDPFAMPGQAGDAPGVVKLVDGRGHVLENLDVEMVQNVSEPEWTPGRVRIKLLADWPVPP
jgi:hypothetical protein